MLQILNAASFTCPRTCTPGHWCQFRPIFEAMGSTRVMSHTVKVTVEFREKEILVKAVHKMEGQILSDHNAYGLTFTLPNFMGRLSLTDTTLAYDSDNDHWHPQTIPTLKARYAVEAARQAADQQGWMSYDQTDGSLVITHPSGGTMTVQADGTVDSVGFIGQACDVAQVIENSIGKPGDRSDKPEYFATSLGLSL